MSKNKISKICSIHGEYLITPYRYNIGKRCQKCAYTARAKAQILPVKEVLNRFNELFGETYRYFPETYKTTKLKMKMECSKHGVFYQTPERHFIGKGCRECGVESIRTSLTHKFDTLNFDDRGYSYLEEGYVNQIEKMSIICPIHGTFRQSYNNHVTKQQGCPKCTSSVSKPQQEVEDFMKDITDSKIITNDRTVIGPKELDIYIPEHKLAIEFNGVYWHSKHDKKYHQEKTIACAAKGIRLIHIYEDQWKFKRPIVESILRYAVGNPERILYARKTEIVEISAKEAREFYSRNHIYEHRGAKYKLGLKVKDTGELVSAMTFGFSRFNKNYDFELIRFANKLNTSIVGGAQRLWKHFRCLQPEASVLCYADASLFTGALYEKLGFTNLGLTPPNHWYLKNGKRLHRMNFTKVKMLAAGHKVDDSLSAHQNALNIGYPCIYDSGSYKLETYT